MSEIFIIGNGFDLHHGLETSYAKFHEFAEENSCANYEIISDIFLKSHDCMGLDLEDFDGDQSYLNWCWCDFESSLGLLNEDYFIDKSKENISEYMYEIYMDEALTAEFVTNFIGIYDTFRDWISQIEVSGDRRSVNFGDGSRFINFNYTETLEIIYGIDPKEIFYIHGRRKKNDNLIVDHGEIPPIPQHKDDLPDIQGNIYYNYLRKSKKPTDDVLINLNQWLKSLRNIDRVSVRGHSMNYIDLCYFKEISARLPNASWSFSYHSSDDLDRIRQAIEKIGILPSQINSVATLAEFEQCLSTNKNALKC